MGGARLLLNSAVRRNKIVLLSYMVLLTTKCLFLLCEQHLNFYCVCLTLLSTIYVPFYEKYKKLKLNCVNVCAHKKTTVTCT